MKNILVISLFLLPTLLFAQKPIENKFVIANAEANLLYRHYDNIIAYSSDAKMDSIWIECDSAKLTFRNKNYTKVEITSETVRYIDVNLKGKKRRKIYELGKQKFLVQTIPVPTLFLGAVPVNSDLNNHSDEIFEENRLFLKTPSSIMISASNTIESVNLTIEEEVFTIRSGHIPNHIQAALQNAPSGTIIYFNYYIYSGTGGHEHEKVNLNIFYVKKGEPK